MLKCHALTSWFSIKGIFLPCFSPFFIIATINVPIVLVNIHLSREDDGSEHLASKVTFAPVFLFSIDGECRRFVMIANAFMTSLLKCTNSLFANLQNAMADICRGRGVTLTPNQNNLVLGSCPESALSTWSMPLPSPSLASSSCMFRLSDD